MKLNFLLALAAFMIIGMLVPDSALSQKKYYILFDNFEDEKPIMNVEGMQNPPVDLFNIHYWNPLKNDLYLGKYAERKPFSASTFAQRDITDYDVAIFVMGTQHHLGTVVDGIKVLDKVKQMLNANKSVIIVGYSVLAGAFAPGGDLPSKSFLTEWLGIDNPRQFNHSNGGVITGMKIKGYENDPIAKGYPIWCNYAFNEGGDGTEPPYRYYPSSPFFEIKGGKNAVGFDYVTEVAGTVLEGDPVFVGARAEQGRARLAFWSINYDITNSVHRSRFYDAMLWAIKWMVRDIPNPEGFLRIEDETLDFGIVEPNLTKILQAVFMNTGRETLTVSKFEIVGEEAAGTFEIVDGGEGLVMNAGDVHFVDVKFSPKEEKNYEDYLAVTSNGVNGNIEVKIIGQGGEQAFTGPRLSVTRLPVDFGTLPYAQIADKNIAVTNTGTITLIVNSIKFIDDSEKRFKFVETISTPFNLAPGETYNLKVRFSSLDDVAGEYKGQIALKTTGLNDGGDATLELVARGAGKVTESGLTLSTSSIEFGTVEVGQNGSHTLKVTNSGKNVLRIFSVAWDKKSGGENLAQFSFLDGTDKLKPALDPGESYDLKIQFAPLAEKDYAAKIQMLTNDLANDGIVEVPISGKGKNSASVKDAVASISGLTVSINPTPINENGTIELKVELPGSIEMNVIDQTGRRVAEVYKSYTNQGLYTKELSASNLANGMYYLVVKYNGQQLQVPFVVSK